MKKKILMGLSLLAVAGLSIGGTVAYFKAQDTTVNTFTYGKVAIQQLQYEREVDENGNWITLKDEEGKNVVDKYTYTPDRLVEYKNNKQLIPAVFVDGTHKWDDRNGSQEPSGTGSHQQSWGQIGASGSNQLFDSSMKNVQDNFVFVKNTGTNDAYVRTYFAFEQGNFEVSEYTLKPDGTKDYYPEYFDIIEMNTNLSQWHWELVAKDYVIYDEQGNANNYVIMSATYLSKSSTKDAILKAGDISYPSLLQIYMQPEATQEDIELLDGNENGQFDVLIATQAVQTDGFAGLHTNGIDDANNAFDKAFGDELPFKTSVNN